MAPDELPPGADALYGLALEDFVAARDALAKRLRGDGDREGAGRVAALRKPSVAAWTVNQLVRSRGRDVDALAEAADRLRAAQGALLEGRGSAADLRAAREAERAAVDWLLEAARGLFPGGREAGETTLERVASTLHAVATDEAAREEVLSGCLLHEHEPSGFGDLEVALGATPPAAEAKSARRPSHTRSERAERERRAAEAREAAQREAAAREAAAREAAAREAAAREAAARERRRRRAEQQAALDEAVAARERAEAALEAARAEEQRRRAALDEER